MSVAIKLSNLISGSDKCVLTEHSVNTGEPVETRMDERYYIVNDILEVVKFGKFIVVVGGKFEDTYVVRDGIKR